ncbi:MAG: hypothetical protein HWN68_10050 [Desulfobacterales bacterium]|nr:hypothetical protein [Desulfobacterales bacterium]
MYYVGNGVILTLDIEEGTITAESKEIYDVPKDISEEQIWKMHQSIVDRNIQSYTAWISTGKITKRKPVYFLSIEDQERQATIDTPFIDIDTQTGKMLLGGHPVEQDSNSVVESFVLYPKESLYDKPRPLRINLEIIDINTP